MIWVKVALGLFNLAHAILTRLEKVEIENAAVQKYIAQARETMDRITREALEAGRAAHDAPIDGDGDSVPDNDGHRFD